MLGAMLPRMARPYRDGVELVTRPAVLMPPWIIEGAVTVLGVANPGTVDTPLPITLDPRFEYRIRPFVSEHPDDDPGERRWFLERRAVSTRD
jgi:hypothetical protein